MNGLLPLLIAQTESPGSNSALVVFAIYTLGVFALAILSNRLLQSKSFLSEYFLGSRGLGVWAFALTFAATSSSGGSFMGFPSLVYSHGWSLALWIGSYMLVPIVSMGLLAKRINQVARKSDSITVPDVLRERFESVTLGVMATLLIVFFMVFNLVAQFKGGAKILSTLLADIELFQGVRANLGAMIDGAWLVGGVEPGYLICLSFFGVAVIIYTSYGGFRAVVWTDVMQGLVMVVGVIVMLPLAIHFSGGLGSATDQIAKMTPPRYRLGHVNVQSAPSEEILIPLGTWLLEEEGPEGKPRVFRTANKAIAKIAPGETRVTMTDDDRQITTLIPLMQITTPAQVEKLAAAIRAGEQRSQLALPVRTELELRAELTSETTAETERVIPAGSCFHEEGREDSFCTLQQAVIPAGETQAQSANVPTEAPEYEIPIERVPAAAAGQENDLPAEIRFHIVGNYAYGDDRPGVYVSGPGPHRYKGAGFLPLSLAISFFCMWTFSGAGQPSNMVRLMAFNSSRTLRRAIFTVAIYYSLIYFPLVIIFCCARVLLPGMEIDSDRIMPEMAKMLTGSAGMPWLAGLLVAAPFAAVMSTVDSFLLMISSAVVRDVYQRDINPAASEKVIKRLTYTVTVVVGVAALLGALRPPAYLQDIIVYTGSGLSGSFLMPVALALYWPRFNAWGAIAGMAAGFLTHLSLYVAGFWVFGAFRPVAPLNFDPILPAFLMSLGVAILVTLLTAPPPEHIVRKFFWKD